jgi:hypothetical protein
MDKIQKPGNSELRSSGVFIEHGGVADGFLVLILFESMPD